MKKIFSICFFVATVAASFVCFPASAQNSGCQSKSCVCESQTCCRESYDSFIEVNGYAEKEVAPDVFYMRIEIDEQNWGGKKTLDEQQKAMIRSLKALGIDTEKQLTRLSLSSSFYKRKTNYAVGTYELKLTSAEDVSKVWRSLDALGISNVSFTKAEYSKIDQFKDTVRADAVRNARCQAETMASAIGQSVGKCFFLCGGYAGSPVIYAQPRMMKAASFNSMADGVVAETEEEAIEFGNIRVSVTVTARFILK